jgi:hypothetical protein
MYVHRQLEKLPFQISEQLHVTVNGLQTAKEQMDK